MGRFIGSMLVAFAVPLAFALFRRWAPRHPSAEAMDDDGRRLPYGLAGFSMAALGLVIAVGGFFILRGFNHLWAAADREAVLVAYPPAVWWCFLPGFAAVCLPWLIVLALLRQLGYAGQAASIVAEGNEKTGYNGERVMRGLAWGTTVPLALVTLPGLPAHMTVSATEARVTRWGHVMPEVFKLADARAAYWVTSVGPQIGRSKTHPDLFLTFADGRRLDANAMGDGGTSQSEEMVRVLLENTHLRAALPKSIEEIDPVSRN